MPAGKVFASCDDAVADVFDGATIIVAGDLRQIAV